MRAGQLDLARGLGPRMAECRGRVRGSLVLIVKAPSANYRAIGLPQARDRQWHTVRRERVGPEA
jgi:hypothetical protein